MKCDFCKQDIEPGTGKMDVTSVGKSFHFCSGKCEANLLELKRNPRKVKWVRKTLKSKKVA